MNTEKFLNGHYTFDGYTSTRIFYDNENELWRMELLSNSSIHATTMMTEEYPLGNLTWNVITPIFDGPLDLNLNNCDDFSNFNCNDGTCIDVKERYFM